MWRKADNSSTFAVNDDKKCECCDKEKLTLNMSQVDDYQYQSKREKLCLSCLVAPPVSFFDALDGEPPDGYNDLEAKKYLYERYLGEDK